MINRKIKIVSNEEYERLMLIQATFKIAIDSKIKLNRLKNEK